MKLNKNGASLDFIFIIIFILIAAISIIVGATLMNAINSSFQNSTIMTNTSKTAVDDINNRFVNIWDYSFLFLIIGLYIALMVSAYFLDTSPIFFILSLIFSIIAFFVGAILNNVFFDVASSPGLSATANKFIIIPYVMDHFLPILVFYAISFMVVMYAKNR